MIIYATNRIGEGASTLFDGSLEECRDFLKENDKLDLNDYDTVNICEDNGVIVERIKERRAAYQSLI